MTSVREDITPGPAFDRLLSAIERRGFKITKRTAASARAQCPAHDGGDQNLSILSTETRVNTVCHSHGCDTKEVLESVGLTVADRYHLEPQARLLGIHPSASYTYDDGRRVFRDANHKFRQSGTKDAPTLYRATKVTAAVKAGTTIYLVEGEEDVHAAEAVDLAATTAPQGAENFDKVDPTPLTDANVMAIVDKDPAGAKWAAKVRAKLVGIVASIEFRQAKTGKDLSDHLTAGHGIDELELFEEDQVAAHDRPRRWAATDLVGAQQPEWLAKRRIPKSAVTILIGDEGIGKSLFWVWITAAITTGRALPEFGIPARTPGAVLLVITEDEWSYTVRPRLEAAGADLGNVQVICTDRDGSGSPIFPRDMHLVAESGADLVVIDAFLDTVAANITMKDPQQARLALHPWKEIATSTGAAIMLLTHTNRVDSKNARDRYGITGELRKKARMTLYAQLDDEERLVIGPEKSNIVGKVPASAFRIDPIQMFPPTEEHDGTVPVLAYLGESELTAREHIEANHAAQHGEGTDERTEAEQWLEDYLAMNPGSESKAVKADAKKQAGISEPTLKRAAKKLGVVTKAEGFPRRTTWTLPDRQSAQSDHEAPHMSESEPTEPTGPDKGKHTEPTGQSAQSAHAQSSGLTGEPTGDHDGDLFGNPGTPDPPPTGQVSWDDLWADDRGGRRWTRDDLLFPGSTTCKACGNDLVNQPGSVSRCRDKHDVRSAS